VDADFEQVGIHSAILRDHLHTAGAPKNGDQAIGRSRGRLITKIHAPVGGLGMLARFG